MRSRFSSRPSNTTAPRLSSTALIDLHFSEVGLAELYDVLYSRGSSRRDFDFYLPLIMAAESVLDVGHTFQVFLEDEEIRRTLAAIRELLAPQVCFAFETRNPAARDWQTWPQKYSAEVLDRLGRPVSVSCRIDTPFDGRVLSFSQTYTSAAWDKPRVSSSTLRFLDPSALAAFLAEAGLAVERQFGDWDRSALSATSPEIISVARRR